MKKLILLTLSIGFSSGLFAQNYTEIAKLTASDRDEDANYGSSVAISGNYAIAGAMAEDFDASGSNYTENAGAVYFSEKSGNSWQETQKLVASDRASMDYFGSVVSMSGNYAFVGAWGEDEDATGSNTMTEAGAVYVFERTGSTWTEVQKLVASNRTAYDHFGRSIAISDNYAIIGNDFNTVYFFELSGSGVWNEAYWLHSNSGDYFGYSVDIDGTTALVGATRNSYDENEGDFIHHTGAAYFVSRDGTGNWNVDQKVVASDRNDSDNFGSAVALDGNRAIIGAYRQDYNLSGQITGPSSGAAYIFEKDGSSWIQKQKVIAPNGSAYDEFGTCVAMEGDHALIGLESEDYDAPTPFDPALADAGAAYLLKRNATGSWNYTQILSASDKSSGDHFGNSVAISGEQIMVGAIWDGHDANGQNVLPSAGSAYIFEQSAVGISEAEGGSSFQVFPNPSDGHFAVTNPSTSMKNLTLTIVNSLGLIVSQKYVGQLSQGTPVLMDVSALPNGMFVCEVRGDEISFQQRIVIEH
ncbi:MAG: T9SS type A sorting domain-containing protein [Flavobacteriales bacterium]|nr:T9SS type A sorting domain-containing protein [Flavobacteriales bacterium]